MGNLYYEYHLKDHLGSVHVAFVSTTSGTEIVQENAYYPFGGTIDDFSYNESENRYKHTGMEAINDFGLNMLDNNARWRDVSAVPRFYAIDPLAEKYYSISPYAYCANNPVKYVDPNGEDVYLLFYTVGNRRGDEAFKASAQTRKEAIESGKNFNSETDKVLMVGVSDISDVGTMSEWAAETYGEKYGQTAEVGVWSHGAMDGPLGTEAASISPLSEGSKQMSMEGWGSFNYNWKEGASMSFYGCNTGRDASGGQWVGSFARNVSALDNMQGVSVWGQSTSAFPSTYPHLRATTALRSVGLFLNGQTYMVGGNAGEGARSHWFYPGNYPSANPMNVYRGGKKVKSAYQGF